MEEKMNAGQVLEDIVYRLLRGEQYNGNNFYFSVAENVYYKDEREVEGEIDVLAIRHIQGKKRYVVLVECKLSNRRTKATKQLRRAKEHILKEFPKARIFCIYVYNYNPKTRKYTIEWLREV